VATTHQVRAVLLLGCVTGGTGCLTLQSRYSLMDFGEAARTDSSGSWPILLAAGLGAFALGGATLWAWQRFRRSLAADPPNAIAPSTEEPWRADIVIETNRSVATGGVKHSYAEERLALRMTETMPSAAEHASRE
jgi:hypothetical protein